MIDLYTWATPNGYKASIALEELELAYRTVPVNISAGEQFTQTFLEISPNNKIPAIVDHDGPGGEPLAVFESGAILIYLAEKAGRLLPADAAGRSRTIQWLMFQMGGLGPMLGQAGHFLRYAPEPIPYAIERYTREAGRLFDVMDRRLASSEYLADDYSIADIACFPWIRSATMNGYDLSDFQSLSRWFEAIQARPAVARGLAVPEPAKTPPTMTEEARRNLFGDEQYRRR